MVVWPSPSSCLRPPPRPLSLVFWDFELPFAPPDDACVFAMYKEPGLFPIYGPTSLALAILVPPSFNPCSFRVTTQRSPSTPLDCPVFFLSSKVGPIKIRILLPCACGPASKNVCPLKISTLSRFYYMFWFRAPPVLMFSPRSEVTEAGTHSPPLLLPCALS